LGEHVDTRRDEDVRDGRIAERRPLMATLTVWKFEDAGGAARAEDKLVQLQKQDLIHVHDAALVSWPEDKKKPKTTQLNHLAGAGALGGAFWGLLFGLLFFIPLFGIAVGAALGAIGGCRWTTPRRAPSRWQRMRGREVQGSNSARPASAPPHGRLTRARSPTGRAASQVRTGSRR
jgi:hypothetical protein